MREARTATHLMIWTDCDREGEFIGSMVAEVCRKANPNIIVKRARFSAIIPACVPFHLFLLLVDRRLTSSLSCSQINQAARNPVDLDIRQAQAVAARMELDLRVGSIFTRTQTLELQRRINAVADSIISYGASSLAPLIRLLALLADSVLAQVRASSRPSASSSTSTSACRRSSPSRSGSSTSASCARRRPRRSVGAEDGSTTTTSPRPSTRSSRTTLSRPSPSGRPSRRRNGASGSLAPLSLTCSRS